MKRWFALTISGILCTIGIDSAFAVETEIHRIETADNSEIVLSRYANPGKPVILLCHGISSNHWFWDFTPDRSLALYLYESGYDVWNLDLRGHGLAARTKRGRRPKGPWSIDTYGLFDLPAAITEIKEKSPNSPIHFVGHSMGGMVLAVYLATSSDVDLTSAVVVASPLDFREPDRVTNLVFRYAWLGAIIRSLPTPMGARWISTMDTHTPLNLDAMLYNPDNIKKSVRKALLRKIVSPVWRGEVKQFQGIREGEFLSIDGNKVWRDNLTNVKIPMLFFAGRADRIAHPDRVWTYYEAIGSSDKEFIIVSKANGFSGNYGHLDFGLADEAPREIYPKIKAWIDEHP